MDWTRYFTTLGKPDPGDINVGQPAFFKEFEPSPSPTFRWRSGKRTCAGICCASRRRYLSKAFVDEDFDFNRNLQRAEADAPRWKRVLRETNNSLGEALGQLYVAQAFPPQARQRALDLVLNLKAACATGCKPSTG